MSTAALVPTDRYFFDLPIDPRLKHYPFIGNPLFPLTTCGCYLWFVYLEGPRLMEKREPLRLRLVIQVYNLIMVVANTFFFYKFITNSFLANYSLFCQGMSFATDYNSMQLVHWGYWYYLLRVCDLLDTIFAVLRKKSNTITFQHVSHHFCCVFSGHIWMTLGMDGQTLAGLCLNSCIHIFMYTYYFLATLGPRFRKHLWWKKYLTRAQIFQHILVLMHGIVPILYDCGYPRFFIYIGVPQGLLGLILFVRFYTLAYMKKEIAARENAALERENAQILLKQKSLGDERSEDAKKLE